MTKPLPEFDNIVDASQAMERFGASLDYHVRKDLFERLAEALALPTTPILRDMIVAFQDNKLDLRGLCDLGILRTIHLRIAEISGSASDAAAVGDVGLARHLLALAGANIVAAALLIDEAMVTPQDKRRAG